MTTFEIRVDRRISSSFMHEGSHPVFSAQDLSMLASSAEKIRWNYASVDAIDRLLFREV